MAIACCASLCSSKHTTEIEGRRIKFYSFPSDQQMRARWETVCRSVCNSVQNKNLFRLCELHFEQNNFTEKMQLKSNAVPTIFDRPIKRKAGNLFPRLNCRPKRLKSGNEDENISVAKSEILFTSAPLNVSVGPQKSLGIENQTLNSPLSSTTKSIKGPHYRLIIQIDKIRARPGPKSKKLLSSAQLRNKLKSSKNTQQTLNESTQKNCNESVGQNIRVLDENKLITPNQHRLNDVDKSVLQKTAQSSLVKSEQKTSVQKIFQHLINSNGQIPRCKSGCQLENIIWNTNPAFKCKKCNNVYIPQPINEPNKVLESNKIVESKNAIKLSNVNESNNVKVSNNSYESDNKFNQCNTCQQTFETPKMLYSHIKEHLTCDICCCLFKTLFEYKSHMALHTSTNPSMPYLCHICDLEFGNKISLQKHVSDVHLVNSKKLIQQNSEKQNNREQNQKNSEISEKTPKVLHQCKTCNMIFVTEEILRKHMDFHKDEEESVSPVGQLRSVKFSCTICNMEFPTLAEIDAHTRTHIQSKTDDLRCNICKKVFTNDRVLSNHLREHVLRARRCHLCPKAFIDLSTLGTHLKNHV